MVISDFLNNNEKKSKKTQGSGFEKIHIRDSFINEFLYLEITNLFFNRDYANSMNLFLVGWLVDGSIDRIAGRARDW